MRPELFSKGEGIPILKSWWKTHTGYDFKPQMAAQHGIIVRDSTGLPLCLCFLYFPSNSRLCQLAFLVRNPQISPIRAGRAIKLLVAFSVHACKKLGYDMLYTASSNKTVRRAFKDSGFEESYDEGASVEYSKEL